MMGIAVFLGRLVVAGMYLAMMCVPFLIVAGVFSLLAKLLAGGG
jgi:hypothetical protein